MHSGSDSAFKRPFLRFVAATLATVLFAETAFAYKPQANVWEERAQRRPVQVASANMSLGAAPASAQLNRLLSTLPAAELPKADSRAAASSRSLPATFVSSVNIKRTLGSDTANAVILLEDVHHNVEAQTHLSLALQALGRQRGSKPMPVSLEGATGAFRFTSFHRFPDAVIASAAADAFLASGDIGGPSHAGFVTRSAPGLRGLTFTGADDAEQYRKNVSAYRDANQARSRNRAAVARRRQDLGRRAAAELPSALAAFNAAVDRHHAGEMALADYARTLAARADASFAVRRFIEAHAIETRLDLARVDAERRRVLEKLVSRLSPSDISSLVSLSLGYRNGTVSFGGYYEALRGLCARNGVDLRVTPAFDDYIRYVLLADGIDADALFSGIEGMESAAYARLATTESQRRLVSEIRQARLAERLVEFGLTSHQWGAYRARRPFGNGIDLSTFEAFYDAAEARDRAMAASVPATGNAVLVAGGFHTEGVTALLRQAGRTVIVCSPKLTKADPSNASAYLSVFDRERAPLERIFAGEKLFLASLPAGAAGRLVDGSDATSELAHVTEVLTRASGAEPASATQARQAARELGDSAAPVSIDRDGDRTTVVSRSAAGDVATVVRPAGTSAPRKPLWRRASERVIGTQAVTIFTRTSTMMMRGQIYSLLAVAVFLPATAALIIYGQAATRLTAPMTREGNSGDAREIRAAEVERRQQEGLNGNKGVATGMFGAMLGALALTGGSSDGPERAHNLNDLQSDDNGMHAWVENVSKRAIAPGANLVELAADLNGERGDDAREAAIGVLRAGELAAMAARGVRGVSITVRSFDADIRAGEYASEIASLVGQGVADPAEIFRRLERLLAIAARATLNFSSPLTQVVVETDMDAVVREGAHADVVAEIAEIAASLSSAQPRVAAYLSGRTGYERRGAVHKLIMDAVREHGAVPQVALDFGPHTYVLTVKAFVRGARLRLHDMMENGATPDQLKAEVTRLSQSLNAVSIDEIDREPEIGVDALIDRAIETYRADETRLRNAISAANSDTGKAVAEEADAAAQHAVDLTALKGKAGLATGKIVHQIYLHIFYGVTLPENELESIYGEWMVSDIREARGDVSQIRQDTGAALEQRFMVAAPDLDTLTEGAAAVRSAGLAGGWMTGRRGQTHAYTVEELGELEAFLKDTGLPRGELVARQVVLDDSTSDAATRVAYARTLTDAPASAETAPPDNVLRQINVEVFDFLDRRDALPAEIAAAAEDHSRGQVSINDLSEALQIRAARRLATARQSVIGAVADQIGRAPDADAASASNRSIQNRVGLAFLFAAALAASVALVFVDFHLGNSGWGLLAVAFVGASVSPAFVIIFLVQGIQLSRGYHRGEASFELIPEFHDLELLPDPSGPATSVIHNRVRLNPYLFDTRRNRSRLSVAAQRSILAEERRHIRYRVSRGFPPEKPRSMASLAIEEVWVNTVMPIYDFLRRQRDEQSVPVRREAPAMDLSLREELSRLRNLAERLKSFLDGKEQNFEEVIFISDQHGTIDVFDALLLDAILNVQPIAGITRLDPSRSWTPVQFNATIVRALRDQYPGRVPTDYVLPSDRPLAAVLEEFNIEPADARSLVLFHNPLGLSDERRYGVEVSRRAKELSSLGWEFKLNPDKTLDEQLVPHGVSLEGLKGKIFFHNLGDFKDRGPYGIKILNRSRELIDAGLSDFIVGNHDLWTMMNLLGIHIPWYRGFQFYGYRDSYDAEHGNIADVVAAQHDSNPETLTRTWWASRLAEYEAYQTAKQKDLWSGSVDKLINGDYDKEKKKYVKGTGLYSQVAPTLRSDHKKLWDKLKGFYLVDIQTGTRAVGHSSIKWWEELLAEFHKAYAEVRMSDRGQVRPAHAAWEQAINTMENEIIPTLRTDLEQHLVPTAENPKGQWWWRVFEAINYKNYTSPEWWAKDWVFHEGWGPNVLKEANEIEVARLGADAPKVTPANYFENPMIESAATFYKEHFTLFGRDDHQNTYMHAFLPVDMKGDGGRRIAGEFNFGVDAEGKPRTYKGVEYRGNGANGFPSVWEGLERIQNDIRSGRSLSDINEALDLVNSWYADNTTVIKPPNVVEAINTFGAEALAKLNGFNRLYTGHIPFHEFSKIEPEKLGIVTGFLTAGRIVFTDQGMGVRFGSRGGYVVSSVKRGLFLQGREMEGNPAIIPHPRTMKPVETSDGVAEQVLFENPGIDQKTYLNTLIDDVERRIEEIHGQFAQAARSFSNRIMLALPFLLVQSLVLTVALLLDVDVARLLVVGFVVAANVVPVLLGIQGVAIARAYRRAQRGAAGTGLIPEAFNFRKGRFPAGMVGTVMNGEIFLNHDVLIQMSPVAQRSVIREELRHLRYQRERGLLKATRSPLSLFIEEFVVNIVRPVADLFRPDPDVLRLAAPAVAKEEAAKPVESPATPIEMPAKPATPPTEADLKAVAEKSTPDWVKANNQIDLSNNNAFTVTITRGQLDDYSEDNPNGLGLRKWLANYKKEARISTAGIRGPNNILYPQDTRNPIHLYGIMLATLGKALVLKDRYPGLPLHKIAASEVRYNSATYVELIARVQAAQGITTHVTENYGTLTIWITSFLAFMWKLVGAEYVTSSHGISTKNATKDLTDEGGQFLPEESEQFVRKIEEIFSAIERDGSYDVPIANAGSPLIDQGLLVLSDQGTRLYVDYLKKGIATPRNLGLLRGVGRKIVIDTVGGSMLSQMEPILAQLMVDGAFEWLHGAQDPFFHGIGKEWVWDEKNGRWAYNDLSADTSITKVDASGHIKLPVVETMGYDRKLAGKPVGTVVLMTDPDGDRLITCQIEPASRRDDLDRLGIAYMALPEGRVLAVYMPNQSFLLTMAFQAQSLKRMELWDDHPRFMIKTTASAASWDEWATANAVKVVNVPVGFKEIAAMMRKVEKQLAENPDQDVIVEDVFGQSINLGKNPRLLFAGEESGGEIFGPEELIEGFGGRKAIAMREKSAGEALVITAAMAADMELQGKYLSEYLGDVFEQNDIVRRYDYRHDQNYYNESEPDPTIRDAAKAAGEKLKTANEIFFLSIALAVREGKITHAQAVDILAEAFPALEFRAEGSKLERVDFVGDGTYLLFQDKFVEIRPSGTDAKSKGYAAGNNKPEAIRYATVLASYDGARTPLHQALIPETDFDAAKENSLVAYDQFARKDAPTSLFQPEADDTYLLDEDNYGPHAARRLGNRVALAMPFVLGLAALVILGGNPFDAWWQATLLVAGLVAPLLMGWQWVMMARASINANSRRNAVPLHWAVERYPNYFSGSLEAGTILGGRIALNHNLLAYMPIAQQRSVIAEEIRHLGYQRYFGFTTGEPRTDVSVFVEEFVVNFLLPIVEIFRPNAEIRALGRPFSPEEAVRTAAATHPTIARLLSTLKPSTDRLQAIVGNFMNEMQMGMRGSPRSLEMIRTEAKFPTGQEKQFVVALDWGGSTARLALWELQGNGRVRKVKTLPDYLFNATDKTNPRGLYPMLADKIDELVASLPASDRDKKFTVVVGFAFPPSRWSKGWKDPQGLRPMTQDEHRDRFNAEFARRERSNLTAEKGENDTLDPMMIETYERRAENPAARAATISVILGTGHNVAAEIDGAIWNFESGAYDGVRTIETEMDRLTDRTQENRGEHLLEKMVAGGYLGEIVRNSLGLLRQDEGMFAWAVDAFTTPNRLPSKFVSEIAATNGNSAAISGVLAEYGVTNSTWDERATLFAIAEAVLDRSARIVAVELAATLRTQDPQFAQRHFIPIEGSVFEKAPRYPERLRAALVELLGADAAGQVELIPNRGRAGSGTAVLAATAGQEPAASALDIAPVRGDQTDALQARDSDQDGSLSHWTFTPGVETGELTFNRVFGRPDGTLSMHMRAIPSLPDRADLAVRGLGDAVRIADVLTSQGFQSMTLEAGIEKAVTPTRAAYTWGFRDAGGEVNGMAILSLEEGVWTVSVRTSIPQLTNDLLSHLVAMLSMTGMSDSGLADGSARSLGNRLGLAATFVAPVLFTLLGFVLTGHDPFNGLASLTVILPLAVFALGAVPFLWQAFWVYLATRGWLRYQGLAAGIGMPYEVDTLGRNVVAFSLLGTIFVNKRSFTRLPQHQQHSAIREERRHLRYWDGRTPVTDRFGLRTVWEEYYVNVIMPVLDLFSRNIKDGSIRLAVKFQKEETLIVDVRVAKEKLNGKPRRFPPYIHLNADLVGALGFTLLGLGVAFGAVLLAGSILGWTAYALYRRATRHGLADRWISEGRSYASVAQAPARSANALVDALDAAAPKGVLFGDRSADDLRSATLAGFAAQAAKESSATRRLLQWATLAGYRRSVAGNGAAPAADRVEQVEKAGAKTRVIVYHVNQLGSEDVIASELKELQGIVDRVAVQVANGEKVAVVAAVSAGLSSAHQRSLAAVLASARGAAVRVDVTDDLRATDAEAYSYEKLLLKAAEGSRLEALEALAKGNYDSAAFVTFSKVPSQFLADGNLRAVWTLLANIGAGWAPLPVDTLIRAAVLARQSA